MTRPGVITRLQEHAECSVCGPITQGRRKTLDHAVEAHMKDHPPSTRDALVKVGQWAVPVTEPTPPNTQVQAPTDR